MKSDHWRSIVAALTLIFMTSGSTAMSSLFVVYRQQWGITSAEIAIVFSVYVGALLPVLLFFGTLSDKFGPAARSRLPGSSRWRSGISIITLAHNLPTLILARLFQGIGVGLSVGAVSAAFADTYRGKLAQGNALQSITAVGLFAGPVVSAIAYNLGWGLNAGVYPRTHSR